MTTNNMKLEMMKEILFQELEKREEMIRDLISVLHNPLDYYADEKDKTLEEISQSTIFLKQLNENIEIERINQMYEEDKDITLSQIRENVL